MLGLGGLKLWVSLAHIILTPIMAGELSRRPAFESFEFRVQGFGFLHGFWV